MANAKQSNIRTIKPAVAPAAAIQPASWEKYYDAIVAFFDGKKALSKTLAAALKGAKYDDVVRCVAKMHKVPVKPSTHFKVVEAGGSVTVDRDHKNAESARKDITDVLAVMNGGKTRSEKQGERNKVKKAANKVATPEKVFEAYLELDAKARAAFRKMAKLVVAK